MAEKTTIARPYAEAIGEMAKAQGDYKSWSDMLAVATELAANDDMGKLIGNPNVTREQLVDIFNDVCGDKLNQQGKNLIALLAENDRLNVLAEIAALYEELRASAEGAIQAEVTSAMDLSDAQQSAIAAALQKRLGREVTLVSKKDESLIGGVIIRAGDLVIDGSAAGKLAALGTTLLH